MERWSGRVAVVTGASAGIGAAIAYQLQDHGLTVVALARRVEKIEGAVSQAREEAKARGRYQDTKKAPGKLYTKSCDVSNEESILSAFQWVKDTLGGVDVLVNNAGIGIDSSLTDAETKEWQRLLDTNVLGLSICTREAVKSMRARGVDDGHIIHISSVCAHVMPSNSLMAMYYASKHAVRALTEGLRKDFVEHKEHLKVTEVSPGFVKTDFILALPKLKDQAEMFYSKYPYLFSEDIADAVTYTLSTPPHVQIHEMIVKPVGETD